MLGWTDDPRATRKDQTEKKKLKEKEHSEIREELLEVKQMLANLTAQARL